jgi:hypothetical protein
MMEHLQWLSENAALVSSLATVIMALVWVFYAHLLYRDFNSRHHPRIMIHQAPDVGLDSVCLVINIGERMVNIAAVIAAGYGSGKPEKILEITEYRAFATDSYSERELTSLLKQGPVASGDFIHLGSFKEILEHLSGKDAGGRPAEEATPPFSRLEIRVVMFSGPKARPLGAWRGFSISRGKKNFEVHPLSIQTFQMTSYRERNRVKKWLAGIYG